MVVPLYQNPDKGGGLLGWSNCAPTCTAMLINFANPTLHPQGADVRRNIVDEDGRPDTQGGTTPTQNVAAAKHGFGVTLDYQILPIDQIWAMGSTDDTMLSLSISYAPVAPTKYDGSPGFTGFHDVVLYKRQIFDPLADGRRPGIPLAPDPWPFDIVKRALEGYSHRVNRGCVIVAKAPKSKPKRYSVRFEPGAIFVYPHTGGRRRDDGFSKETSAPCSAPYPIPWNGGSKRVVEISAGRLKGLQVEPTATHMELVA